MRISDLIERHCDTDTPLHQLDVDDAVCEILRSKKQLAEDLPSLVAHGRSAHDTAAPEINQGTFAPPFGSKGHGYVGVDAGGDVGVLHSEVLCTPGRLILVAFATYDQYRRIRMLTCKPSITQTALFVSNDRALSYYETLQAEMRKPYHANLAPFFLSIPNGVAFLRTCDIDCKRPPVLKTHETTGLFKYYNSLKQPSLRFVLQIEKDQTVQNELQTVEGYKPASLEAIFTFLIKRTDSIAPKTTQTSWSGATEEPEASTPSETATVIARCVKATAVTPRSTEVLGRLKKVLEKKKIGILKRAL